MLRGSSMDGFLCLGKQAKTVGYSAYSPFIRTSSKYAIYATHRLQY